MNKRYTNDDNDPNGRWTSGDPTSRERRNHDRYGIQSPYTGSIHYPGSASWRIPRTKIKDFLEAWGSKYTRKDIGDGRAKAFVIKGAPIPLIPKEQNLDNEPVIDDEAVFNNPVIQVAREQAEGVRDTQVWPHLHFLKEGYGRPRVKRYLRDVKKGRVPTTYWADDEYDDWLEIGTQSWDHEESGHSQSGINELDAIMGKGHGFDTVKPLKLFEKIILLWCPPNGLVLDPYAGSGTTGHAVLELNYATEANRRFILIEQGSPERGDKYASTLTQERLRRVIEGERPTTMGGSQATAEPLGGGFQFRRLTKKIDSKTVLSMRKDELIDVVITSHWETGRRGGSGLLRIEDDSYKYLVGCNEQNEGYFLIWNGEDRVGQLDAEAYATVIQEGKKAGLKQPFHVYARYEIYQSKSVIFYKIPDKILAHLGLNENSDSFNENGVD
jgi:adenine-specific DNA-methyltransferase